MTQFIGFHIDHGCDDSVPIATGDTREAVQALTIRRVLGIGCTTGSIAVQERPEVPADVFAATGEALDMWFASKGVQ